jgi:hypothetical protein
MTLTDFLSKMTLSRKDAEVIFDRDEPVGQPTDLVMPPPRRWFRRKNAAGTRATQPPVKFSSNS